MSLKLTNRFKNQAGDTLVEVMIAIAIIALAITISFSISGKNLNVGITARERNSATGLVQGQIERMKAVQQTDPTALDGLNVVGPHFCFDSSDNVQTTLGIDPLNNSLASDAPKYTHCTVNGFYLDITYIKTTTNADPKKSSGNSFMFTGRWFRVGGGVDQIVTVFYRPW